MANLITKHDPYHVHKTLGLLGLLHFIYRFFFSLWAGNSLTDGRQDLVFLGIFVHAGLSLTSLLLPLPKKRMFTKPMIWPEFRLHNIVFALRHIVATLLIVSGFHAWANSLGMSMTFLYRLAIILVPSYLADQVTERIGDKELRTTNSMPYPYRSRKPDQVMTKDFYAMSQFLATALAATDDPEATFWPVLGIQMAAFSMTLVRKGIIDAHHYHFIYSVALMVPSFLFLRAAAFGEKSNVHNVGMWLYLGWMVKVVRFRWGTNKYVLWSLAVCLSFPLYPLFLLCPTWLAQINMTISCGEFVFANTWRTYDLCIHAFGIKMDETENAKEKAEEEVADSRLLTENEIMSTMKSVHEKVEGLTLPVSPSSDSLAHGSDSDYSKRSDSD